MDKHYEYLTKLYLRLKGFIVSNLIIHSETQGDSDSEIDIIGIRMPFHLQEDRQVDVPDELECSNSRIEIIIADVKNCKKIKNVKFNRGLRRNRDSIRKLVNWIGCIPEIDEDIISEFEECLNLHRIKNLDNFVILKKKIDEGNFNIKFTFFCPSLADWNGKGFKYISGNQMIDFIWECLNDKNIIETCSRRYDFGGWNDLEDYVRFFKISEHKVTKQSFEQYFNIK